MGQQRAKQQKRRRVIIEIIIYTGGRGALFGGIVLGSVIGELRRPGIGQAPRRVETDKIGAGRRRERDDQTVGSRGHENKDCDLDGEKYSAIKTDAVAS